MLRNEALLCFIALTTPLSAEEKPDIVEKSEAYER